MTPPEGRSGSTWRRLAAGDLLLETLRRRSRILERIRSFFRERGFL